MQALESTLFAGDISAIPLLRGLPYRLEDEFSLHIYNQDTKGGKRGVDVECKRCTQTMFLEWLKRDQTSKAGGAEFRPTRAEYASFFKIRVPETTQC